MSSQKGSLQSGCGNGGAVELTEIGIINATIAMNETVFFNYYDSTYRTERNVLIWKEFDKVADLVKKTFPKKRKIVMAKVDYHVEKHKSRLSEFGCFGGCSIIAYRNGKGMKQNCYLFPSIKDYVFSELEDPSRILNDREELENLNTEEHLIIGYFDKEDMPEYDNFRRVALNLKENCQFYVRYGYSYDNETSTNMRPPNQPTIVFKSGRADSKNNRETFKGCVKNYDDLNLWAHKKCLVREMTADNFEKLRKKGHSIILFYNPSNHKCIRDFCDIVGKTLMDQKYKMNFLTADGIKFGPYLRQHEKNKKDLPIIMKEDGIFLDFKEIYTPRKLKAFAMSYSYKRYCASLEKYVKSMQKNRKST